MKERRMFGSAWVACLSALVAATVVVLAGLGGQPEAEAQMATPPAPGKLEAPYPGNNPTPFEYSVPINPYELAGEAGVRAVMDKAKSAGANEVSLGVFWPTVQQTQDHQLWLDPVDIVVRQAAERGMRVSIFLNGTPDWVHPNLKNTEPDARKRQFYPPQTDAERQLFKEFTAKVAARYGTRATRYKIWNEPNNPAETMKPFSYAGSAGPYAQLLRAGYNGIKERCSGCMVTFGGMSSNDTQWLQYFYDAAKQLPNAAASRYWFDEMDVHPYTRGESPEQLSGHRSPRHTGPRYLHTMKQLMDRNGDTGKKIFVGEMGYQTYYGSSFFEPVPDSRRALYIKQAYSRVRELPWVSGMNWYAFHPSYSAPGEWNMMDANLNTNRTYVGFREAIGWYGAVKAYPRIPSGGIVSGAWRVEPVYEGGAAPSDVARYELFVDGVLKKESTGAPFSFDSSTIPNGKHEVVLAAYTRGDSVYSAQPVVLDFQNAANTRPTITNVQPAPGAATSDRSPAISAIVRDRETNLQRSNITKVLLDGKPITWFGYDAATDKLYFTPSLAPGSHSVKIEATDERGLTGAYVWGFAVR